MHFETQYWINKRCHAVRNEKTRVRTVMRKRKGAHRRHERKVRTEKIHKQAGMGAKKKKKKNHFWSQKTRGRRIECSRTEEDLFRPLPLSSCITIPTLSGRGRREDLQQLSISSGLNLHRSLTKQTVWRRDLPGRSFVYPAPSLPAAPDPVGV